MTPIHIGAFTNIPDDRLFTNYEIPPFGKLGESPYDGLNEDRINCVYVNNPKALDNETRGGSITNAYIRYVNYVRRYVDLLRKMGAEQIDMPSGRLIILDRNRRS